MEISNDSHHHKLTLKHANCPYYCGGCGQLGFGLTYICSEGCNFFLHKECGKPEKLIIKYPFSEKCVMKFRDGGSGVDSACDACGKKIQRLHYRCTCNFMKRNLHPWCLVRYEKTLDAIRGLTLHLRKVAASKCLHCRTIDLRFKVRGWAYVSPCGTYSYHVACVMEMINTNWKNGFFTGKNDPFLIIKQQFPEDMDQMHKLTVVHKEMQTKKQAKAMLSVLYHVFTGNPFGLIGAAKTFFDN